jgi:solute:Na+ symporter, SSS family
MAMAAKGADSAQKVTVIAAAARLAIPFLLVLPGAIAISLPTPQSKTIVRNENGAIYHEITVVPKAVSEGKGLVPAIMDPATSKARIDGAGHEVLDYAMATPNLITHFATTGLLGLAIAALLASLMSGVASGIIAVGSVFAQDLYEPLRRNRPSDGNLLTTGRWASAVGLLLSVGAAFAIAAFSGKDSQIFVSAGIIALLLVFSLLQAPQLATFVLGAFTRRISGNGAFAGLAAGVVVAVVHYGLTLPTGAHAGYQGGWLADLHRYPGILAQSGYTVVFSFAANLGVAWVVSLGASTRPEAELRRLTYSPSATKAARCQWQRSKLMAMIVILITVVLALIFA